MARKATKRKPNGRVVTAREQLALEQRRSMQRAVNHERTTKRLMRELAKRRSANLLDGVSLAATLAEAGGYKLVKASAGE